MTDRRFIEESFPVKEVGQISAKEKNIRHGHISTLHIWWARRPLAASRATAYAALTPAPKSIEEWDSKRKFIVELSQWKNSNNQSLLKRAKREILDANGGVQPKVLDPFSGGGSYPMEALRLGCESYANDYNPVAVLIEKATLEYPQKYGRYFDELPEWANQDNKTKESSKDEQLSLLEDNEDLSNREDFNPLLNAVRYWGKWVRDEARKELAELYPPDSDGSIPVGYIWARTIPCQNPSCRESIPLLRQMWLAKTDKKKIALQLDTKQGKIDFRIVGQGHDEFPEEYDPGKGTISRAVVTCPICGSVVDEKTTRKLFQDQKTGQRLIAVVLNRPNTVGKLYRVANERDFALYETAERKLQDLVSVKTLEWGINPVPDEPLPLMSGVFNVPIYGLNSWGALFNSRQLYSLITIADLIRKSYELAMVNYQNSDFAKAVVTYLALAFDKIVDYNSNVQSWHNTRELVGHTFVRQALQMVWDYAESNPIGESFGDWLGAIDWVCRVLEHARDLGNFPGVVTQQNATNLNFPDNYFDAVLTDPPYYNSVPYADLSDFFYVWLKRTIGLIYPEIFSTPLSPKDKEITEMAGWDPERYPNKDKNFFEDNLKAAFLEIERVLKPNGIATIVYAHKSTEGWETVINALLDSGLVITGAWPINTEMQTRLRASEAAALASSIYIVARKSSRQSTGFYNEVRTELRKYLDTKLERLWAEGIGGADFFIAAIGSAIEVFGKYEQVMDYEGNIVRADRLLEEVRTIATDYAVRQILHNGFAGEITPLARLYVLWRWNYGEAKVPFDEARKLSQSCGLDISQEWSKNGFVRKEKEFVRLLGPQNRKLDDLKEPRNMIDVMHKSLLLWEKSQRSEMVKVLAETGFGTSEAFYRVGQAVSETLPNESKEKKLLDGFLAGRERVQQEVEDQGVQGRLFE